MTKSILKIFLNYLTPFFLFAIVFSFFILYPAAGNRNWDALMTASVLKSWKIIELKYVFFFAHSLVIPITKLFTILPFKDMLFVTVFREVFFAGLNAVLIYLFLNNYLKSHLKAFITALVFAFIFSNWKLTTYGEEKQISLFFNLLFVFVYFHYKNIVRINLLKFTDNYLNLFPFTLGFLLFLAFAVHLQNLILLVFLLVSFFLDKNTYLNFKLELKNLFLIIFSFLLFCLIYFLPIIIYLNKITTLKGIIYWFGEYHLNKENVQTNFIFGDRLNQAYMGFRSFITGYENSNYLSLERNFLQIIFLVFTVISFKINQKLTFNILLYIFLFGGHFFFYRPYEAEAWAGVSFWGILLFANVTLTNKKQFPVFIWIIFLLVSLGLIFNYNKNKEKENNYLKTLAKISNNKKNNFLENNFQNKIPQAVISTYLDKIVENNSLIIVESRFWLNALLIYTNHDVVAMYYINYSRQYLRKHTTNTILSIYFYFTEYTSDSIKKLLQNNRKVYFFTYKKEGVTYLKKLLPFKMQVYKRFLNSGYVLYRLNK